MEYYMRLPRNRKEFIAFMLVVSVISVNIIAPHHHLHPARP